MNYEGLFDGLLIIIQPENMLAVILGCVIGIIVGALPGLGSSAGMALLLPIVFFWPPEMGLFLLTALWMADQYGGSICSILLNIPGGAGAVFTCLDGHPMAQNGRASNAIGYAMVGSAVGGTMGALTFLIFAPPVASLVLKFGSPELFLLAIVGLSVIAAVSQNDPVKGFIGGGLGLMFSFVGIDLLTGYPRYAFGTVYLLSSMELQVIILGLFAVGKLIGTVETGETQISKVKLSGSIVQGFLHGFKFPVTLIRGGIIGSIIGAIPATGVGTATPLAYQLEMTSSKTPEKFGTGMPEGVLAPESANNATAGGALIPTLTMGIPGSPSAAVFLGGLVMYGIAPGADIFIRQGPLVWSIFWALLVSILAFVIFGMIFNKWIALSCVAPLKYMMPIVFALVISGAYACNTNPMDVVAVFLVGILGYLTAKFKYSHVPILLGFVLGPIAEQNFFRSLLISHGSYNIFFASVISWILWVIFILALVYPYYKKKVMEKRIKAGPA